MEATVSLKATDKNLAIQQELDKKAKQRTVIEAILPFAGLVFIFTFFVAVTGGRLLSSANLENLINQSFMLVLVAVGAAFVYAHGGMDFSMGTVSGVAQLVMGLLLANLKTPVWLAVLSCILTSMVCMGLVGGLSLVFRVPVFVCSLCIRSICTGILNTVLANKEILLTYSDYAHLNNTGLKAGVLLLLFVVGFYLFNYTAIGKNQRAIGGNQNTTKQAGISISPNIFVAFLFLGICIGVASFFSIFRVASVSAQSGSGLEFNIMTAIALGGFPFAGGDKARLHAAVIGAITVSILTNGLALWGLDVNLVNGVKGALFIAIVGLSYDRSRK
ncbi:MAG: ABC transporter permease [Treponema sp.]|jgi:ribose transport system permease protein|nr:ABC transporter permease [Treponema sp.]